MIIPQNLKPFPKFCYTIGMIPSSYKESLTYEEQLIWFCSFLQDTVIPTVNNNGMAVTELQNLYIELKNYVDTYFENLDVQEEINNKLDEMAEDGTLQEIITSYLQIAGVLAFNTVQDMKEATNLIDGSFVKTYGFYSLNDLGGSLYKVRNITNDDIIDEKTIIELANNNLIAELIINSEMNVEQFGAYGDNETDDTLAIQTAINNCNKVIFNKTYKTLNQININKSCELIGNGMPIINSTLSGTDDVFKVLHSNVNFENLEINLQYNGGGVHGEHGATICFGTYKTDTSLNLENFIIRNCKIKRQGTLSENIAIFGDTHNVLIENCYIYGECITLHWSGDFDETEPNTSPCTKTFHPYNILIQNNVMENNRGVMCSSAYNVKILNNKFINNTYPVTFSIGDYGNTLALNNQKESIMTGLSVENCSFSEYSNNAVYITGYGYREDDTTYQKNYITNSKISIKNCSFEDSTQNPNNAIIALILSYGLTIENCKFNTSFRKNAIYGNPMFDCLIKNCNFNILETPISIYGGKNIKIEKCNASINNNMNFIKSNQYTFSFTGLTYNVENLKIIDNDVTGATTLINLQYTSNALIQNNNILNCIIGIHILGANNNNINILNNKFSDSSQTLIASHYNIKSDVCNNLNVAFNSFNGSRGVAINSNSFNNRILHNTLINNPFNNALLSALVGARTNKDVFLLGNIVDNTAQLIYGSDYQYINYIENT